MIHGTTAKLPNSQGVIIAVTSMEIVIQNVFFCAIINPARHKAAH